MRQNAVGQTARPLSGTSGGRWTGLLLPESLTTEADFFRQRMGLDELRGFLEQAEERNKILGEDDKAALERFAAVGIGPADREDEHVVIVLEQLDLGCVGARADRFEIGLKENFVRRGVARGGLAVGAG